MSYQLPSAICAEELRGLDKPLAIEIACRYNAFSELKTDLKEAQLSLDLAISALKAAGFSLCENGHWRPPLGPSVGSIFDQLDVARNRANSLALATMELVQLHLQNRKTAEPLSPDETRQALLKAIEASLIVLESQP